MQSAVIGKMIPFDSETGDAVYGFVRSLVAGGAPDEARYLCSVGVDRLLVEMSAQHVWTKVMQAELDNAETDFHSHPTAKVEPSAGASDDDVEVVAVQSAAV